MTNRDRTKDMQPAPALRIGAFALAIALSALTLGAAVPGGASYVAGRLMPGEGNAFQAVASRSATEVEILPGRIEVVGIRAQAAAAGAAPAERG